MDETEHSAFAPYYQDTCREQVDAPALRDNHRASVVVIGGGLAGVCTALGLAERGVRDVLLLEANEIGYGASGRNGGFVFGGYSLGAQGLIDRLGLERARTLYQATVDGIELLRKRIKRYRIDCEPSESGVLLANWFRDPAILHKQRQLMADAFGVDWQLLDQQQLAKRVSSPRYSGALYEPQAFHVQPLAMVRGLARAASELGVRIHQHSPVIGMTRGKDGTRVLGLEFDVQAERIVVAGGGYLQGHFQPLQRAMLPIATYVMVTEPLGDRLDQCLHTASAIYDTRFAFDYYRPLADTRILWGGRISIRNRSADALARILARDMGRVFPQLGATKVDSAWSGAMGYSRHEMPQIGSLRDDLWYAQSFGGHGLVPTTVAGETLAGCLAGEITPLRELFGEFGLENVHRRSGLGMLAAQARYSWLQGCDWWRTVSGR